MVNFPEVEWIQQSLSINPSGFRNAKNVTYGFLKVADTTTNGVLDFGELNTTGSGAITDTKLVYARINSMGDSSGIYNMKMFITDSTAWGAGTYRFLERKSFHFIPNLSLNSSADNTPTTIPSTQNIFGTIMEPPWSNGQPWMSGILDNDSSQYIYLAVEVGVNVPIGTYGGAGAGTFRYRLLYDFS